LSRGFLLSEERMAEWTFITRHGLVLNYLSQHPQSRARDVAAAIGVTGLVGEAKG
jgi:hypothetical protein